MNLKFEPSFVEEAVFLGIRSLEQKGERIIVSSFSSRKNQIYENFSDQEREQQFQMLFEEFFSQLGSRTIFERLLSEFPLLNDPDSLVFIKKVWGRKEEGAQLYVDGKSKTVLVGVRTERLENVLGLESFLRQEIFHIHDMLDPAFEYVRDAPLGGNCEAENDLVRGRFRLLWDIFIAGRLIKEGRGSGISCDELEESYRKAFSFWSDERRDEVFQELMVSCVRTQKDLIRLAGESGHDSLDENGSFRCSLCGFPYTGPSGWVETQEKISVLDEIKKDFPEWEKSDPLCRQCCELYRAKKRDLHELSS